jgi:hypothetical protein
MIPQSVIHLRMELCPECAHLAHDPCSACDHGKWGAYVQCEEPLPPVPQMAANLAQAAFSEAKSVLSGEPPVSEEESARRLAICHGCPHFRHSDQRCPLCGCFMNYKATLRSQHCPVGKW